MSEAFKLKTVLPGETIGVLGAGQLGRMLALSAARLGYQVIGYSPEKNPPLSKVAHHIQGEYEDLSRLDGFLEQVKVVTLEFENIPLVASKQIEKKLALFPGSQVLEVTQNRIKEKNFLSTNNFPVTPYRTVTKKEDLLAKAVELGFPCILKTAGFGYDGKGQVKFHNEIDVQEFLASRQMEESILEAYVQFEKEVSVVCARSQNGAFVHWELMENVHENHILDLTISPARVSSTVAERAFEIAKEITQKLGVVGTFCVEFFLTKEGKLIVNEMAPRPHNSGHLTIEASVTSQFEQQLRAVAGLPLGSTKQLCAAAMVNLLGDLWENGEPHWKRVLELPGVYLHLYGKSDPRPGRKMGHLTCLSDKPGKAAEFAIRAREMLS